MTSEQYDVVVVGSGLVGAAVAYELIARGINAVVLESCSEPGAGASRSNSGIVHTGFDSPPGTLETALILQQGRRWRLTFEELGVPYREPGALLVARDEEQAERLPSMAENAAQNGVEVRILDADEARKLEPRVPSAGALHVPGEAITDPFEFVRRLLHSVPVVRLNQRVTHIGESPGGVTVSCHGASYSARFAVNCAGLYGDEVAGDDSFTIRARRGEFVVFEPGSACAVEHILLPIPTARTKGVLVFPTVHGYLCAGPSAVDQDDKEDWRPRQKNIDEIVRRTEEIFPPAGELRLSGSWAGLRPVGVPNNYLIEWSGRAPGLLNVAGIRSTGLSSCLGISQLVIKMLEERGLALGSPRYAREKPLFDDFEPWWNRLNSLREITGPC